MLPIVLLHARTFERVASLKKRLTNRNQKAQYEAHSQLIFRIRDQFGEEVVHHDVIFKSRGGGANRLERMIEDKHVNTKYPGTVAFYLRTQRFDKDLGWCDLLEDVQHLDFEITGDEPESDDIHYLRLSWSIEKANVPRLLQNFRTIVVDVTLLRLPSRRILRLTKT